MHNHYIINNIIEFHPATSTLRDLNDPTNIVVLNSPAGRCLLLLINRQGNIVTQHEVMDTVWEQSGMQVSPNTYYQNISILRKGLKKIGIGEELIVTIPRIGLTLASGTHIKKLITENEVEIDQEHVHFINEDDNNITLSEVALNDLSTPHPSVSAELVVPEKKVSKKPFEKRLSRKYMLWISTSILIPLAFVIVLAFISDAPGTYHFFDKYSQVTSHSGCNVYISNDINNNADREKALSYVLRFEETCQSYPWLYISRFPMLPRTSIIRCDAPMSQINTCISDYFFESNK